MKLKFGNIFDNVTSRSIIFITTNYELDKNKKLVMGAGAALEAKNRWTKLPKLFGKHLIKNNLVGKDYYLIPYQEVINKYGEVNLVGAIQTKRKWRDKSSKTLIYKSMQALDMFSISYRDKYDIHCVLPGVQNGKLSIFDSIALASIVNDGVTFWTLPVDGLTESYKMVGKIEKKLKSKKKKRS